MGPIAGMIKRSRCSRYRLFRIAGRLAVVFVLACRISFPFPAYGQTTGDLEFRIQDSATGEMIDGAVAELLCLSDSTRYHAVSHTQGKVIFKHLSFGNYLVTATHLAYAPCRQKIRFDRPRPCPDTIPMQPSPLRMEEIVVTTPAVRSVQNGDTLIYRAAAYKVAFGSSSEALLAKMPGLTLSDMGMEAHGQNVRKVMIDGKEFFGNDVLSALKNLPADLVEDVEVFHKLSDEAELTGIDDGRGYTAVNIVTRTDRHNGLFGRLYASYGLPDKYIAGGNINHFGEERRLSFTGLANNVSRYNFTTENIAGAAGEAGDPKRSGFFVKPLPGISSVQSFGTNFSNKWFSGNYFFNRIDNSNHACSDRENPANDRMTQYTQAENDVANLNYSHRFSAKIEWNTGKRHSFIIRPALNIQDLTNHREQRISVHKGFDAGPRQFLYNRLSDNGNDRSGLNFSNAINYRYRFLKQGRVLSASLFGSYYGNHSDATNDQSTFRQSDIPLDPLLANTRTAQQTFQTVRKAAVRSGITFTEPLSKRFRMSWQYNLTYSLDEADKKVYLCDRETEKPASEPDVRQSSTNSGSFFIQKTGPRLQYSFRKTSITAGGALQHTGFKGGSTLPPGAGIRKSFVNLTYEAIANISVTQQNTIRIEAKGYTVNPSAVQMQNVINMANRSHVSAGNPDLEPAYLHDWDIRYTRTDPRRGRTVVLSLNYRASNKYIADSLVMNCPDFILAEGELLGEGNQFLRPINIRGYYRLEGKIGYGLPVPHLRSNLNLRGSVLINRLPGVIDGTYSPVYRNQYLLAADLHSNIGENLDFHIGYSGTYVQGEFSTRAGKIDNNYFSQNAKGEIKGYFGRGFLFMGTLSYLQNKGFSRSFNDRVLLCNLYVGKRLFRNRSGEISLGINDLFDNNRLHYIHTINSSGTNDTTNQGIGRYFALQFIWHIRSQKR